MKRIIVPNFPLIIFTDGEKKMYIYHYNLRLVYKFKVRSQNNCNLNGIVLYDTIILELH